MIYRAARSQLNIAIETGCGAKANRRSNCHLKATPDIGILVDFYRETAKDFGLPVSPVDPAPEDIRRLRDIIVQRLINQTRPGATTTATDFQRFIDSAKTMSKEELFR